MKTRFENTGEHLSAFADVFYVHCPQCDKSAIVRRVAKALARPSVFRSAWRKLPLRPHQATVFARIVCPNCGYTKDAGVDSWSDGTATDWYFNLPLWFQVPCCGETLWAYNRLHLAYLKRYVEADLRDECSYPDTGLARYLPKWMKLAKNRDEVLRCIEKLMQA